MQFTHIKHFLGVDVGKEKLSIVLRTADIVLYKGDVENKYEVLIKQFKSFKKDYGLSAKDSLVCMEFTGMYNFPMLSLATTLSIPTWVIAGMEIKNSLGIQRGKSDPIDASRIAEYSIRFLDKIVLWTPPRQIIKNLQVLIASRDRLIKCRMLLEVPLHEMENYASTEDFRMANQLSTKPIIELEKSIKIVDLQIEKLIESDPEIKEMYKKLTSIKGVGKVIAVTFIAKTNEFKNFKNTKKLACHCGIAPFSYSSGKKQGQAHISHKANKELKTLLDLGARAAITAKGELQDYYNRKLAEGKQKTSIRNAVRYKLLSRMMAVIRNNTMYENNYLYKVA